MATNRERARSQFGPQSYAVQHEGSKTNEQSNDSDSDSEVCVPPSPSIEVVDAFASQIYIESQHSFTLTSDEHDLHVQSQYHDESHHVGQQQRQHHEDDESQPASTSSQLRTSKMSADSVKAKVLRADKAIPNEVECTLCTLRSINDRPDLQDLPQPEVQQQSLQSKGTHSLGLTLNSSIPLAQGAGEDESEIVNREVIVEAAQSSHSRRPTPIRSLSPQQQQTMLSVPINSITAPLPQGSMENSTGGSLFESTHVTPAHRPLSSATNRLSRASTTANVSQEWGNPAIFETPARAIRTNLPAASPSTIARVRAILSRNGVEAKDAEQPVDVTRPAQAHPNVGVEVDAHRETSSSSRSAPSAHQPDSGMPFYPGQSQTTHPDAIKTHSGDNDFTQDDATEVVSVVEDLQNGQGSKGDATNTDAITTTETVVVNDTERRTSSGATRGDASDHTSPQRRSQSEIVESLADPSKFVASIQRLRMPTAQPTAAQVAQVIERVQRHMSMPDCAGQRSIGGQLGTDIGSERSLLPTVNQTHPAVRKKDPSQVTGNKRLKRLSDHLAGLDMPDADTTNSPQPAELRLPLTTTNEAVSPAQILQTTYASRSPQVSHVPLKRRLHARPHAGPTHLPNEGDEIEEHSLEEPISTSVVADADEASSRPRRPLFGIHNDSSPKTKLGRQVPDSPPRSSRSSSSLPHMEINEGEEEGSFLTLKGKRKFQQTKTQSLKLEEVIDSKLNNAEPDPKHGRSAIGVNGTATAESHPVPNLGRKPFQRAGINSTSGAELTAESPFHSIMNDHDGGGTQPDHGEPRRTTRLRSHNRQELSDSEATEPVQSVMLEQQRLFQREWGKRSKPQVSNYEPGQKPTDEPAKSNQPSRSLPASVSTAPAIHSPTCQPSVKEPAQNLCPGAHPDIPSVILSNAPPQGLAQALAVIDSQCRQVEGDSQKQAHSSPTPAQRRRIKNADSVGSWLGDEAEEPLFGSYDNESCVPASQPQVSKTVLPKPTTSQAPSSVDESEIPRISASSVTAEKSTEARKDSESVCPGSPVSSEPNPSKETPKRRHSARLMSAERGLQHKLDVETKEAPASVRPSRRTPSPPIKVPSLSIPASPTVRSVRVRNLSPSGRSNVATSRTATPPSEPDSLPSRPQALPNLQIPTARRTSPRLHDNHTTPAVHPAIERADYLSSPVYSPSSKSSRGKVTDKMIKPLSDRASPRRMMLPAQDSPGDRMLATKDLGARSEAGSPIPPHSSMDEAVQQNQFDFMGPNWRSRLNRVRVLVTGTEGRKASAALSAEVAAIVSRWGGRLLQGVPLPEPFELTQTRNFQQTRVPGRDASTRSPFVSLLSDDHAPGAICPGYIDICVAQKGVRTLKYAYSLARGTPPVTIDYLRECDRVKELVDPTPYMLPPVAPKLSCSSGSVGTSTPGLGYEAWVQRDGGLIPLPLSQRPLTGVSVFVVGQLSQRLEWISVLHQLGASVMNSELADGLAISADAQFKDSELARMLFVDRAALGASQFLECLASAQLGTMNLPRAHDPQVSVKAEPGSANDSVQSATDRTVAPSGVLGMLNLKNAYRAAALSSYRASLAAEALGERMPLKLTENDQMKLVESLPATSKSAFEASSADMHQNRTELMHLLSTISPRNSLSATRQAALRAFSFDETTLASVLSDDPVAQVLRMANASANSSRVASTKDLGAVSLLSFNSFSQPMGSPFASFTSKSNEHLRTHEDSGSDSTFVTQQRSSPRLRRQASAPSTPSTGTSPSSADSAGQPVPSSRSASKSLYVLVLRGSEISPAEVAVFGAAYMRGVPLVTEEWVVECCILQTEVDCSALPVFRWPQPDSNTSTAAMKSTHSIASLSNASAPTRCDTSQQLRSPQRHSSRGRSDTPSRPVGEEEKRSPRVANTRTQSRGATEASLLGQKRNAKAASSQRSKQATSEDIDPNRKRRKEEDDRNAESSSESVSSSPSSSSSSESENETEVGADVKSKVNANRESKLDSLSSRNDAEDDSMSISASLPSVVPPNIKRMRRLAAEAAAGKTVENDYESEDQSRVTDGPRRKAKRGSRT